MAKAKRLHTARAARAARYREAPRGSRLAAPPRPSPTGGVHGWQAFVALYQPETAFSITTVDRLHAGRNALMLRLAEHGIETRPGTHAVHVLDFYRKTFGYGPESCPNAWIADQASFALPLFPTMTDAEQDEVIEAVRGWDPRT
jgi:perosamine synthetase